MAYYGIKVTLPGKDDSDLLEELALSSEYGNMKMKMGQTPPHFDYDSYAITANPSVGATTNLVSIPHGYTYIPAHLALLSFDQTTFFIGSKVLSDFINYEDRYHIYCTATDFKIDIQRVTLGGASPNLVGTTIYYKYNIFADDGI